MSNRPIQRHNFELGDIVTVFNRTLGGKFIIEGKARIRYIRPGEDMYTVKFLEDTGPRSNVLRYVDPNGQDDPEAYVKKLNACKPMDARRVREAAGYPRGWKEVEGGQEVHFLAQAATSWF